MQSQAGAYALAARLSRLATLGRSYGTAWNGGRSLLDTGPMNMVEEQSRIVEMIDRGASVEEVEADVINDAPCDDDEKAALWLFAWAFTPPGKQRHDANRYLWG